MIRWAGKKFVKWLNSLDETETHLVEPQLTCQDIQETDLSNVIPINTSDDSDNWFDCDCGEVWFNTNVVMTTTGAIESWSYPLICTSCGRRKG